MTILDVFYNIKVKYSFVCKQASLMKKATFNFVLLIRWLVIGLTFVVILHAKKQTSINFARGQLSSQRADLKTSLIVSHTLIKNLKNSSELAQLWGRLRKALLSFAKIEIDLNENNYHCLTLVKSMKKLFSTKCPDFDAKNNKTSSDRTPWSRGLMRHALDRKVVGSNTATTRSHHFYISFFARSHRFESGPIDFEEEMESREKEREEMESSSLHWPNLLLFALVLVQWNMYYQSKYKLCHKIKQVLSLKIQIVSQHLKIVQRLRKCRHLLFKMLA